MELVGFPTKVGTTARSNKKTGEAYDSQWLVFENNFVVGLAQGIPAPVTGRKITATLSVQSTEQSTGKEKTKRTFFNIVGWSYVDPIR